MSSKLIDVSHTVEDGLITYKGLPADLLQAGREQRQVE